MNDKKQTMSMVKDEFDHWEKLVAGLNEEQLNTPQPTSAMSIKDVLAHLMAWQQRSIARLEAAVQNKEPEFPKWPSELVPDSEEGDPDKINAWIYQTYHEQSWPDVHRKWRDGFLRFMELGKAIPEKDWSDSGKYLWLEEYPISAVLLWSYEHHHIDHLEPLLAWIGRSGKMKFTK
jgi:hypothetical protein